MNSRELILEKLRRNRGRVSFEASAPARDREVFKDHPGADNTKMIKKFRERLQALSGEFHLAQDIHSASASLLKVLEGIEGRCVAQDHELVNQTIAQEPLAAARFDPEVKLTMGGMTFEKFACGLSTADYLVARTGSILLRNTSSGGRRLSVLPPIHIVLAKQQQLVPSMDDAIAGLQQREDDWSYACIITGPSRTADIQKNLVLGAHGPKRLVVILIAEQTF